MGGTYTMSDGSLRKAAQVEELAVGDRIENRPGEVLEVLNVHKGPGGWVALALAVRVPVAGGVWREGELVKDLWPVGFRMPRALDA
jgi:hypothetical protein